MYRHLFFFWDSWVYRRIYPVTETEAVSPQAGVGQKVSLLGSTAPDFQLYLELDLQMS